MGQGTIRELNTLKREYEGDFDDDLKLAGRKRKCITFRKSEPNSSINAMKKRRKCSARDDQMMDEDYEEFLSGLSRNDVVLDYLDTRGVDDDGNGHADANLMHDADGNADGRPVDNDDENVHVRSLDDGLDGDGDGDDDDVDPQYKIFLENVKVVGKSYVLEVVRENGNSELIRYEQEDGILDRPNLDTVETWKKSLVKEKTEKKTMRRGGKKWEPVYCCNWSALPLNREESKSPRTLRYAKRKNARETREDSEKLPRKNSSGVKKNVQVEAPENKSSLKKTVNKKVPKGSTKGHPIKRPRLEVPHFSERVALDEEYIELLKNLKWDGGKMVYTSENGQEAVIFDADADSSLDVEIKKEPCDGYFPSFAAVDVDSGRCVETRDTSHDLFRKGLMKDLERPYDEKEYKKLLKEVSLRKPICHEKHLRNGKVKSYPIEGKYAPSYRRQHIVLDRKIAAAKGHRPRILNLLRGFFYWLKNVAKEGSFCPWSDPACLKVLPPYDKKRKLPELGKNVKLPQRDKKGKLSCNYK